MNTSRSLLTTWLMTIAALLVWARCDTVVPVEPPRLVVEGFVDAGKPLPTVRLAQSRPVTDPYPLDGQTAVTDAEVALVMNGERIAYEPMPGQPGRYEPVAPPPTVPPRATLRFEATWADQHVMAESRVPPPIQIDSFRLVIPDKPVAGIILDSLFIESSDSDSLLVDSLRVGAEQGFVYLIEASLAWTVDFDEVDADSAYWVRGQLRPILSGTLDDFFFRPEQIFRERGARRGAAGERRWTGVYAVPVVEEEDPLPPHALRVALIRSGRDYALFASSRDDPSRREPTSNVTGGLGIVAGLSVDTVWVQVE